MHISDTMTIFLILELFFLQAGLNNTLCQAPESASHAASNHHHAARAIHDEYKKIRVK